MSEYTPTTENVRSVFAHGGAGQTTERRRAMFNRWLAAHDAEVQAQVVAEEPEGRRQFTAAYRATNGNVISLETPNMLREAAERTVAEFADEDPEGPDYFVATRILPPWVPVKREGAETDA